MVTRRGGGGAKHTFSIFVYIRCNVIYTWGWGPGGGGLNTPSLYLYTYVVMSSIRAQTISVFTHIDTTVIFRMYLCQLIVK